MQKAIIFTAHNGSEIIDPRPEAEIVSENQRYIVNRYMEKLHNQRKHSFVRNLAHACGML